MMLRGMCCGGLIVLLFLPGCYTYVPVESTALPMGETVAFDLTDRGRVGLSDQIGSGVRTVEGRVTGTQGDQYIVNVFRVASIDGESVRWSGETVRIDRDYVSRVQEKHLSKSRSWLAAGLVAAAVVAIAFTTDLDGFFNPTDDPPPGDPPVDMRPIKAF